MKRQISLTFSTKPLVEIPMVDVAPRVPKKRTFRKLNFRDVNLDALLSMSTDELVKFFHSRALRRL